jgi:hypothetical protein
LGVVGCAARLAPWPLAALAVLVLAGCDAVYMPGPVGDEVVTLDPAEWQGTWLAPDMVITTTVLDGAAGRLQAAWIERGDAGATLEIVEGSIRSSGDWVFASFLDETEDPGGDTPAPEAQAEVPAAGPEGPQGEAAELVPKMEPRFLWVRVEKGENHFTLWSPNVEQFKILVRDGRLAGRVTDDGVELGELSPEQLRMINDPASNLLNWADPAVFVRILE